MKLRLARCVFVLLIWAATSLASVRAFWRAWRDRWEEAKAVLGPQDRALSAALGWDARFTVSALCRQADKKDCRICRFVRALLGQKHINDSAEDEGLPREGD